MLILRKTQTHLLARLPVKLKTKNISLIVTRIILFASLSADILLFIILEKPLLAFITNKMNIRISMENTDIIQTICKNICKIDLYLVARAFLLQSQ